MKNSIRVSYGVLTLLFLGSFLLDSNIMSTILIRHISLLAVLGLVIFDLSLYFQKNVLREHDLSERKVSILIVSRIFIFGLVMTIIASIQFNYVDYSYSLQKRVCSIYDQHHNLIYSNGYKDHCPTVEIKNKTEDSLDLTIIDSFETSHEQLMVDEIDYTHINLETIVEVNVSIEYENGLLSFIEFRSNRWDVFQTNDTTFGYLSVSNQVIDYTDGYIFKEASHRLRLDASYTDILDYDANLIGFDEDDYTIEEYVVTEKLVSDDYIAYDVTEIEDGELMTPYFEFLVKQENDDNILWSDSSINYEISEDAKQYELVRDSTSLSSSNHQYQLDVTKEYIEEGFYNTYIFSKDDDFPILESHHLNHIEEGKSTYEGTTIVTTFERGEKTFYNMNRSYTNYARFKHEKYFTIDQTNYGYLVTEYDYYDGSFLEFIFNRQDSIYTNPYSYTLLNSSTIFQHQKGLFNSNRNPFYDHLDGMFLTIPIYIQKAALD